MNYFYCPDIDEQQASFTLDEAESKHIFRVLRLTIGNKINILNGKGLIFHCELTSVGKQCSVTVLKVEKYEAEQPHIHIALAPTKNNDRLEWFIEKTTEIGVSEITPIICSNSERKVVKHERLQKTAIAAIKQSGRAFLPKINEAIKFKDFLKEYSAEQKFIAHCYEENQQHLKELYTLGKDVLLLIGPEGDFSLEEVENAMKNHNFIPISLGRNRLRTETAGVYACTTIKIIND
ncbi:MAG: 16S rRNA (uracil(1498)-N(3))-methyltransferase [Bacteroidetes bacterium HGW-Bacteroidetes-12]|nr:MAG: 16S rRNA (uracil(1498)-N(3))-methyltransferase [Bacteroidetes bacterium HGW-Bacteroidetes-12]